MNNQLVVITASIREELNRFLKERKFSKIALLADENTYKYCFPLLGLSLPEEQIIVIKSGEEQKNLRTCEYIWDKLTNLRLDRKSLLINLGGVLSVIWADSVLLHTKEEYHLYKCQQLFWHKWTQVLEANWVLIFICSKTI